MLVEYVMRHRSNNNRPQLLPFAIFFKFLDAIFSLRDANCVIPYLIANPFICGTTVLWEYHVDLAVPQPNERLARGFAPWQLPPKLRNNRHRVNHSTKLHCYIGYVKG